MKRAQGMPTGQKREPRFLEQELPKQSSPNSVANSGPGENCRDPSYGVTRSRSATSGDQFLPALPAGGPAPRYTNNFTNPPTGRAEAVDYCALEHKSRAGVMLTESGAGS